MERKVRLVERLLEEGDKVKVTVMFRGREMAHPETGRHLLERICKRLDQISAVERPPIMQGRFLSTVLAPTHKKAPRAVVAAEGEDVAQT
jgi:translation initiation factor IF-3